MYPGHDPHGSRSRPQGLRIEVTATLMNRHIAKLERKWNGINKDPMNFVPREERRRRVVTVEEAITKNEIFGSFGRNQIRRVVSRGNVAKNISDHKKIGAFGWGYGWDGDWLPDASHAGLQTIWVEVSPDTCENANAKLQALWLEVVLSNPQAIQDVPIVIRAEILDFLTDLANRELIASFQVLYLCRTLFAFSKRRAKIVLQTLGQCISEYEDLEGEKSIILIDPHSDDNPDRETETSISMSRNQILANVRRGAGRRIVVEEERHLHFGRVYTALVIRAKK